MESFVHRTSSVIGIVFRTPAIVAALGGEEFERASLLRARDFIRQHYARPIALAELAAVSGLSGFHLVRAFAKAFGLPPHAYQNRVQIANARDLLATGCPPIDVAAKTGHADQSHFTRHFKAIYGVTPGEYRRAFGLDRARRGKNVLAGSSVRSSDSTFAVCCSGR